MANKRTFTRNGKSSIVIQIVRLQRRISTRTGRFVSLKLFSERLNALLFEKDLEELAKMLNVTLSAIYYWKSGKKEISLSNLIALADYFEVSLEYLTGRSADDRKIKPIQCPPFGKRLRKVMNEKGISTYFLRKNYKYGSKHFENWDKGADPTLWNLRIF